ncbi:hypothetical protein EJ08DRAFT_697398 [Tothia fuscella]|uniref:Uncharacterized protein n=1 Tax=Tothia fuscella TaxID=1048955 RepID=A0A9P4TYZ5_9PEZI|nr:hypothetical protein EJ08DRAFT_697398 [Tothia fuscella]
MNPFNFILTILAIFTTICTLATANPTFDGTAIMVAAAPPISDATLTPCIYCKEVYANCIVLCFGHPPGGWKRCQDWCAWNICGDYPDCRSDDCGFDSCLS